MEMEFRPMIGRMQRIIGIKAPMNPVTGYENRSQTYKQTANDVLHIISKLPERELFRSSS